MTTRLLPAYRRAGLVRNPAIGCVLVVSGCEGGWGGSGGVPKWKNPFASTSKTAADSQASKPARVGPDFGQGLTQGRELEQSGKLAEARDTYQKLIVKYPQRYEPYHRLGVVADRQKRYHEAQALYAQAISIHPNGELFNDLGYCYYLQGKLDKAESALLKAVSMVPSNARFRNNLGMVYGYQGRYDEAMKQFRHGGSEADAFYNMAFVLAARDDVKGAKNCFRLALAADPTHKKARDALRRFDQPQDGKHQVVEAAPALPDGRRWEPYIEPGQPQAGPAQAASYNAPAPSTDTKAPTRAATSVHADTQTLLHRARTMMSQRMSERGVAQ
jgi:tetratricopeptide (TPR) repeat protein